MENTTMNIGSALNVSGSSNAAIVDYASLPDYGKFCAYDSQLPIAEIKGTRIVKCLYKASKKDGKIIPSKWNNSYVRVQTRHISQAAISENIEKLSPHLIAYLQTIEDAMIKEMHKKGQLNVYVNSLSLDAIIAELEETSDSGRLNGDKINNWFDEVLLDNLSVQFAEKLGLTENSSEVELSKLEIIVTAYKSKFASLAGGKSFLPENDIKAMLTVLDKCANEGEDSGNYLTGKIRARLENMNKKDDELLLAL